MPPNYTLPGVSLDDAPPQKPAARKHPEDHGPLAGLAWTWNALAILAFVLAAIGVLGAASSFISSNPRDLSTGMLLAIGGALAGLVSKTISALLHVVDRSNAR